jgi:hypothetical protein
MFLTSDEFYFDLNTINLIHESIKEIQDENLLTEFCKSSATRNPTNWANIVQKIARIAVSKKRFDVIESLRFGGLIY